MTTAGPRVRIQTATFDLSAEVAAVQAQDHRIGAVATFLGTVRGHEPAADGGAPEALQALTLEHYPGMTESAIEAMVDAAVARFGLLGVRVVHRVGPLPPGAPIVLVVTAAAHRHAALSACDFLMDYLKTQAPFWKKAERADGASHWVDARVQDDQALARWGVKAVGNAG